MDKLKDLLEVTLPPRSSKQQLFAIWEVEPIEGRGLTDKLYGIISARNHKEANEFANEKWGKGADTHWVSAEYITKEQLDRMKKKAIEKAKALSKVLTVPKGFKPKKAVKEPKEEPYTGGMYFPGDPRKKQAKHPESW